MTPPSVLVQYLAAGMTIEDAAKRISRTGSRVAPVSAQDVRAALRHAAVLLRERSLLPAVESGFVSATFAPPRAVDVEVWRRDPRSGLTPSDVPSLRSRALALIDDYLSGSGVPESLSNPSTAMASSLALRLAERLLLQDEGLEELERAANDPRSVHAVLEDSDRRLVDAALLHDGKVVLLDKKIDRWRRTVSLLAQQPASFLYEEYEDRLQGRDRLQDVLTLLSPHSSPRIVAPIRDLDEQFLAATRGLEASIKPNVPWQPQRWWWYRVPSQIGPDFRERLVALSPQALDDA